VGYTHPASSCLRQSVRTCSRCEHGRVLPCGLPILTHGSVLSVLLVPASGLKSFVHARPHGPCCPLDRTGLLSRLRCRCCCCWRRRRQAEGDSDKKIISALDALDRMGIIAPGEKEREAKAAAEKAERQAQSDKAKADFKAATAAKLAAQAAAPPAPPASTPTSAAAPDNTPVVDTPKEESSQQSALDRMLGIEEEEAPKPAAKAQGDAADKPKVTVSDDVIKELMDVRALPVARPWPGHCAEERRIRSLGDADARFELRIR